MSAPKAAGSRAGFLVDESRREGTAADVPFGLQGRGRPLTLRILHVLEFTDAGAIWRESCWLDMGASFRQLPQDRHGKAISIARACRSRRTHHRRLAFRSARADGC
jgi:hypothetical protein